MAHYSTVFQAFVAWNKELDETSQKCCQKFICSVWGEWVWKKPALAEWTWAEQEKRKVKAKIKVHTASEKCSMGCCGSKLPMVSSLLLCCPHLVGAWEKFCLRGPGIAVGSGNCSFFRHFCYALFPISEESPVCVWQFDPKWFSPGSLLYPTAPYTCAILRNNSGRHHHRAISLAYFFFILFWEGSCWVT